MEKYGSELILTDGKQNDVRKARRKSDVLVDNWKEGKNTRRYTSMNSTKGANELQKENSRVEQEA